MSSSVSEFPPVARLCSDCEKAQLRDDIPQLVQVGSHLEFNKEKMPSGDDTWGIIPTEFEVVDWFPELPKLAKSGRNGCDFCCFLHEAITSAALGRQSISTYGHARIIFVTISYMWRPLEEEFIPETGDLCQWPFGVNAMRISCELLNDPLSSELVFTFNCEVQSSCHSDAVSQWLRLGSRAYPSYCDDDSVKWMDQCIEFCKGDHDHEMFDRGYIPARLVDVSSEIACLKARKDIIPSACSHGFKYTALSYCWGSGAQARTTTDTLQDRQAGITDAEMPQVLRDAIHVTRALGIPFLWIDALCILQDDKSDWEQQCGEMHNIYGSAQVTLCAANSCSSNEGFLQQKSPRVRLPFQSHRARDMVGSFLVQPDHYEVSGSSSGWGPSSGSGDLLYDEVKQSRWNERGWVFQESQLSTRKLIFGRRNMYFSCDLMQEARGRICTGEDFGKHVSRILARKSLKSIYSAWDNDILWDYRKYDASTFTYATDVLPALSGLASLVGNRIKDVYYAGHWGRALYRSLLWSGFGRHGQPLQPAELAIPSWSRVAKGNTNEEEDLDCWLDLRSEIKVPRARVVPVGDNPFGALKECRLWIRGYALNMSRMELQISAEPPLERYLGQWHLVVQRRCFGHLEFDWQAGLDDPCEKCPSTEDVKELKLLLLGSFQDHISEEVPEDEASEKSSVRNFECSESAPSDDGGEEYEILEHSEDSFEEGCSKERISDEETSTAGDNVTRDRQCQIPIRRGYGLIISPTGNDGAFRRVGVVVAGRGSHKCTPHGDGDLKALQSLAQMETVQLV